jgi:hypothetical protein
MKKDFRQRADELKAQLEQVMHDLETTASPMEKRRLTALAASIQRSVRWYTARAGSRNDIHHDSKTSRENSDGLTKDDG